MSDTTKAKEPGIATGSKFFYVIYIRTTPEKLWDALTKPELTKQYWFASYQESDWKPGSSWKLVIGEDQLPDIGEIIEANPPHKLILKWQNQRRPELKEEGFSLLTMELIRDGNLVKLTVIHEMKCANSKFIERVSGGWPLILSSLKSLLETGESYEQTRKLPDCIQ